GRGDMTERLRNPTHQGQNAGNNKSGKSWRRNMCRQRPLKPDAHRQIAKSEGPRDPT
ncbi:hypothetical protein KI387_009421, partial [Taxus chinensis]